MITDEPTKPFIAEALDNYDWAEVFKYAAKPDPCLPGAKDLSLAGFKREDVRIIFHQLEGENDGAEWLGVFQLADGRFAMVKAGCDYTGWG